MQLEQKAKDENIGKVQLPVGHDGSVSRLDVLLKIAFAIAKVHSGERYSSMPRILGSRTSFISSVSADQILIRRYVLSFNDGKSRRL